MQLQDDEDFVEAAVFVCTSGGHRKTIGPWDMPGSTENARDSIRYWIPMSGIPLFSGGTWIGSANGVWKSC